MIIQQVIWTAGAGWIPHRPGVPWSDAHLVLVFGARRLLEQTDALADVRSAFPDAHIVGCSTAGEIAGDQVLEDTVVVTSLRFSSSWCRSAAVELSSVSSSAEAAVVLTARLPDHHLLRHVLVFSDGLRVNGSELVRGLVAGLPSAVAVTGGLSADDARFEQTTVVAEGHARQGVVTAVGLYGDALRIGYGSLGGWDAFGPVRRVTRSKGNVLYELDGQSALALYRKDLGEQARDLPASGLLCPLRVREQESDTGVVRTSLGINDADDSMTFAGDVPEGALAQLMRANFDRLVDGAIGAAKVSTAAMDDVLPQCALLISCVGRKMVLQQRVEEEIEGVLDVVGATTTLTGFYSYGEISPFSPSARCELHNQTMTVTTIAEVVQARATNG
ncbi:MAG: FIST C-terminal domain-containing protein [Acidobacteria bacterium]|nr:FIST C-terminal domain-containing protein [Acidobacteriota bacterium]